MNLFDRVQAVIFDHDGTLVNSEPVHLNCWQETLAPFAQTLSAQEYAENLSGIASIRSAEWLIDKFNLDATADALLLRKRASLNRYLEKQACPLIEHAQPLLEQLAERGLPMAVASGASRPEVERSLQYHQLHRFFTAVATKDDVQRNKPAPDVYLLAADLLTVPPEHCLAIEDSDSGQASALAAGMRCLRLDTPSRLAADARCQRIPNLGYLLDGR